ncbi:bifunctional oligoribonuclease/PAP phosphatase NrnA [Bacteroidota bacterium]
MGTILTKEMTGIIQNINKIINRSKRIAITTHVNPDGDAIGSTLAFYHYLKTKGIDSRIILHSPMPYNYKFLSGSSEIIKYSPDNDEFIMSADAIFIIDLNDVDRTKSLSEVIKKSKAVKIVIDHHIDPRDFADLYLVDSEATSAGELIYYLIKNMSNFQLTAEISECLYAAIMTDSGSFRFPRTDGNVHRIIADLIDNGADPVKLYENIYNIRPSRVVKLTGEAFAGHEILLNGSLCIMTLKREHFLKAGALDEDVEDIVEQSLTIEGVKIGILFSESLKKDEIRISFRSKGDISVRDIAVKFNGGGHKPAAGARLNNISIEEAKEKIIEAVGEIL